MPNFYTDNEDIQFMFRHMDIGLTADIMEEGYRFADEFDFAPTDTADAVDNYERMRSTTTSGFSRSSARSPATWWPRPPRKPTRSATC